MTWLRCVAKDGAFSDETIVEVHTADGKDLSFFVPKEKVKDKQRVEVHVKRNGANTWATLPTADPFSAILVRSSDLIEG